MCIRDRDLVATILIIFWRELTKFEIQYSLNVLSRSLEGGERAPPPLSTPLIKRKTVFALKILQVFFALYSQQLCPCLFYGKLGDVLLWLACKI